jgi:hypothetical protein
MLLTTMCSKSLQHIQVSDTGHRQYFSVFTPENTDEQLPPLNDNFQSMPEIKVTILGTEKLLKNLDPTKATVIVFHNSFLHENHVDSRLRCYADLDVLRCYSLRCVLKVYSIYR